MAVSCYGTIRAVQNPFEFCSPLFKSFIEIGVLSKYLYSIFMDFLGCHTFLFQILYDCLGLCFVHAFDLSHTFHLCMRLTGTEIKAEIWIIFFLVF